MSTTNRRKFIRGGAAAAAAAAGAAAPVKAQEKPAKRVIYPNGKKPQGIPRFNSIVTYGNLVFIAGVGAHFEGDIKAHTKHVLDQIKQELEAAGSSMDKVLKCNVYLANLKDYDAMNEVYQGSFGPKPP